MKALILSTATGGGHNTAAHAVMEALTERGVECRFEDCVAFGGQKLSATVSNVYVKFVQAAPDAFGRLYRFAKAISTPRIKSPVYLFNAAYARKMEQLLTDYAPDLIVCTHMFGGQSVTYLRRHDLWNGLFAMVMTDYTIHPFIEDIECDVMFTCKAAMPSARRLALPKSAYEFTGIPVSLSCRPCTDKRAAKEAVGLDPERPEVVLVGGSMGAGNLPEMIARILPVLGENGHLTVVCGSNVDALRRATEAYGSDPRVSLRAQVTPLTPLIAAADVLVTKSGGLTSTEAMTIGTAIVVAHPIAGCETENARFMEDNKLALWAHTDDELTAKVADLLRHPEKRAEMIAKQHEKIDPDCARKIADILIRRTNEMMGRKTPDACETGTADEKIRRDFDRVRPGCAVRAARACNQPAAPAALLHPDDSGADDCGVQPDDGVLHSQLSGKLCLPARDEPARRADCGEFGSREHLRGQRRIRAGHSGQADVH